MRFYHLGKFFKVIISYSLLELNIAYNNRLCYERMKIDSTDLIQEIITR